MIGEKIDLSELEKEAEREINGTTAVYHRTQFIAGALWLLEKARDYNLSGESVEKWFLVEHLEKICGQSCKNPDIYNLYNDE